MLENMRDMAYQALRSSRGNVLPPIRWAKDIMLFMNEMAGKPLATRDEILERREREKTRLAKLADARAKLAEEARKAREAGRPAREAAPVLLYKDDKSNRDLKRIATVLQGREIPWKEIDVENDEASKSWALSRSKDKDFPLVFIAGEAVGGYDSLVQLDVTGELVKKVFG